MDYRIIDGAENMKMEDIQRLLKMTYWADKRSPETVEKSVKNASCYGIYIDAEEKLVGFKSHKEIAKKLKITEELAESICRMYLTHPGVDVAGILQRIS